MNDRPDPLDELASALLDGEASADEQARAGEQAVRDRVATFESVARAVAAPVPPPPHAEREAAVAAAVAAATATTAPVDLASRRVAARRWLPAAAAVLILAGALGVIATVAGDDDEPTPTAAELEASGDADESFDASAGGATGTGRATAEDSAAEEAPAATGADASTMLAASDLGAFDTEDELLAAVQPLVADLEPTSSVPVPPGTVCEAGVDGVLQLAVTASVAGEGLYVFVLAVEGERRLVARAADGCELRYDRTV